MTLSRAMLLELTAGLTRIPGKHAVFTRDPGFLLAAEDTLRAREHLPSLPYDLTYVLLKPDAFAAQKASTALRFVLDQGFDARVCSLVQVSEQQALNVWRYQWNRATALRMKASLAIATAGPSLLIVLQAQAPLVSRVPASVALWARKGSAFAEGRSDRTLRAVLGVQDRYFGYVHVPDEPADVIRELPLLLGLHGYTSLLAQLGSRGAACSDTALEQATQMERWVNSSSYDFAAPSPTSQAQEKHESVIERLLRKTATTRHDAETSPFTREDWADLRRVSRQLVDNVEGVQPVVGSGEIGGPLALWT